MPGTETAASGAAAAALIDSRSRQLEGGAAQGEGERVPGRGARAGRGRCPAGRRRRPAGSPPPGPAGTGRVGPAQQRPQVVVLAEEGVEAAAHRQPGPVGRRLGPPAHPAAELGLALEQGDLHAAFGQPGRGGQARDPAADHHHVRPPRQQAGVRFPAGRGMPRRPPAVAAGPRPRLTRSSRGERLARNVCTMPRCQPGTVSLCTPVNPASRSRRRKRAAPSNAVHAAAQVAVERGVAGGQPAGRDDDAQGHRLPDGAGAERVPHRVLVHGQGAARPQQVVQARAARRPGRARCGSGRRRGCRRRARARRPRPASRPGCART